MLKKLGFILIAILAVMVGLLVGTLNSGSVQLDLLWIQLELPLGMVILLAFSVGLLTGLGTIFFGRVLPLRLQLRKARNALSQQDPASLILPDD